jgi:hypothetical protein
MAVTEVLGDREELVRLGVLEPIAVLVRLAVLLLVGAADSEGLATQEMAVTGEISAQQLVMPILKIVKLPTMAWMISRIPKLI